MLDSNNAIISQSHRAILDQAEKHAARRSRDAEPLPTNSHAYSPLTDAEWSACAPLWPAAAQSLYEPRLILDSSLEHAAFDTRWSALYGEYGARQAFIRRSRTGLVRRLVEAVRLRPKNIDPDRLRQFEALLAAAEVFIQRRGLTPLSKWKSQRST